MSAGQRQLRLNRSQYTEIGVGINPSARLVMLHPTAVDFSFGPGVSISSADLLWSPELEEYRALVQELSLTTESQAKRRVKPVPPETGRALLLSHEAHPIFREILLKGTGLCPTGVENNKLRGPERGFNGVLELSEAVRDFVHSEILAAAGARVAQPLAVIDHARIGDFGSFSEWTANYARAFRVQTRLSNLVEMDPAARSAALNHAMIALCKEDPESGPKDLSAYFWYILDCLAKHAAIYQSTGFTQDSLHFGQVTLAGEICDLGIGHFLALRGNTETLHPWFRFERQPLLFQNMLVRTHSLKTEPEPCRLRNDSRTLAEQPSLLGFIKCVDEAAAKGILSRDPERTFWMKYDQYYRSFDASKFSRYLSRSIDAFFGWSPTREPGDLVRKLPRGYQTAIVEAYRQALAHVGTYYEKQEGPWSRYGLSSLHKKLLFLETAKNFGAEVKLDFADTGLAPEPKAGFFTPASRLLPDPSFRPSSRRVRETLETLESRYCRNVKLYRDQTIEIGSAAGGPARLRDILIVSRAGLGEEEATHLHAAIKEAFPENIIGIIRPRDLKHILFRSRCQLFHLNMDDKPPHVQRLASRSSSGSRLEPLIEITADQLSRLNTYVENAARDFKTVLGGEITPAIHERIRVWEESRLCEDEHPLNLTDLSTEGHLDRNALLCGGIHNCTSWALTAPIGRAGERLHEIIGMTEDDLAKGRASDADRAFQFILRAASGAIVPCLILWTDEPLDNAQRVIDAFGLVRTPPNRPIREVFLSNASPVFPPYAETSFEEKDWARLLEIISRPKWTPNDPGNAPAWLRALEPEDGNWLSSLFRPDKRGAASRNFANNAIESLRKVFDPWWRREWNTPFRNMLLEQYRHLTLGRNGGSPYLGITVQRPFRVVALADFRSEFDNKDLPPLIYPFSARGALGKEIDFVGEDWSRLELEGISAPAQPEVKRRGDELHVRFPDPKYLIRYLETMESLLASIRDESLASRKQIGLLSRYFQMGVCAHFFPIGNTSLYQLQVLYLCRVLNIGSPYLGYADHHAMIKNSESFSEYFQSLFERKRVPGSAKRKTESGTVTVWTKYRSYEVPLWSTPRWPDAADGISASYAKSIGFLWRDLRDVGAFSGHSYLRVGNRLFHATGAGILEEDFSNLMRSTQFVNRSDFIEVVFTVSESAKSALLKYLGDRVRGCAVYGEGKIGVTEFKMSGDGTSGPEGIIFENCNAFASSFCKAEWQNSYPGLKGCVQEMGLKNLSSWGRFPGLAFGVLAEAEGAPTAIVDWSNGRFLSGSYEINSVCRQLEIPIHILSNRDVSFSWASEKMPLKRAGGISDLSAIILWRALLPAGEVTGCSVGGQFFFHDQGRAVESPLKETIRGWIKLGAGVTGLEIPIEQEHARPFLEFYRRLAAGNEVTLPPAFARPESDKSTPSREFAVAFSFSILQAQFRSSGIASLCELYGLRYMDSKIFRCFNDVGSERAPDRLFRLLP